jgi:TolB-like protein/DNA-binding winged helix-turn-helix (wHTH) protein/tetratricopeptide (TPR) repeat protein
LRCAERQPALEWRAERLSRPPLRVLARCTVARCGLEVLPKFWKNYSEIIAECMDRQTKYFYDFGPFRFESEQRVLLRDGQPVPLPPKVAETLLLLVQDPGQLIDKDDLIKGVWRDTFVEEGNLNKNIFMLRKVLGQWDEGREYIETVPKRGYRFVATVKEGMQEQRSPSAQAPKTATGGCTDPSTAWSTPAKWFTGILLTTVVVLSISQLFWRHERRANPGLTNIHSLAILPLENLSGDPAQDYFADSMTDELITDLGQITNIRVTSRTSSMQYKRNVHKSLPQIARELNVDAIVEGSVLRSGNHVRITAQLIDAPADRHLWAQSYEGELRDVLRLQAQVADGIVKEIRGKLSPERQVTVKSVPTVNPGAYESYLKGFYSQRFNISGIQNSIAYFQQAISQEPDYAAAYTGMAHAYIELGHMLYLPPHEAFPKAKEAALRALQLDDSLADAHEALATVLFLYDWNFPEAEREFRRALELNANTVYSQGDYADYLEAMGRFKESSAATKRLHDLDPLSLSSISSMAADLYWARHYDEAIAPAREVLNADPNFASAHLWLGLAYEQKHKYGLATAELREATRLSNDKMWIGFVAHTLAVAGDQAAARQILHEMETRSQRNYVSPWWFAIIYCGLGDKDRALVWLERAYKGREHDLVFLNVWPMFDDLKSDPQYQALVRRVGLPQ